MASEITLDDLLAKQKAMSDIAATLAGETDTDRIQQLAVELQRQGQELAALAQKLEAQHAGQKKPVGFTEVVLTEPQRERIRKATGVELATVLIPDEAGVAARVMPLTDPRVIEAQAMREAERIKAAREAEVLLKSQMAEAFSGIEAQGNPELNEHLARMKADPKFFGGLPKK